MRKDREIVNKVLGKDFPYDYSMKGSQLVISKDKYNNDGTLGKMMDRDRNDIIRKFQKAGIVAKPNNGGGVTAYIKEGINEISLDNVMNNTNVFIDGEKWIKKGVSNKGKYLFSRQDKNKIWHHMELTPKELKKRSIRVESINEALEPKDYFEIRELIRQEIASVFFDLYKKKAVWTKG